MKKIKNNCERIMHVFMLFSSRRGIKKLRGFLNGCFHSYPNRNNLAWDGSWFEPYNFLIVLVLKLVAWRLCITVEISLKLTTFSDFLYL